MTMMQKMRLGCSMVQITSRSGQNQTTPPNQPILVNIMARNCSPPRSEKIEQEGESEKDLYAVLAKVIANADYQLFLDSRPCNSVLHVLFGGLCIPKVLFCMRLSYAEGATFEVTCLIPANWLPQVMERAPPSRMPNHLTLRSWCRLLESGSLQGSPNFKP